MRPLQPMVTAQGGQFFNQLVPRRAHAQAYDLESRRRLRELSRELTGVR